MPADRAPLVSVLCVCVMLACLICGIAAPAGAGAASQAQTISPLGHRPPVEAPAQRGGAEIFLPLLLASARVEPTPTEQATALPSPAPSTTPTVRPTSTPTLVPTHTATETATPTPSPTPTLAPLVIGHITDAHIGLGWLESQRLPLVVSTLTQQADVLVDTGDCTEHGTHDECREYVDLMNRNATIPWRAVLGPHDTPHIFQTHIGPLEWTWDVGGYRLIGINTEAINYAHLDAALTHDRPCIIFAHFPLEHCSPTDQPKLRQRFREYQVPIYIAGHQHLNSLTVDPESGTMLLIGQRTVRCHYRLITVQGYDVHVEFELACQ